MAYWVLQCLDDRSRFPCKLRSEAKSIRTPEHMSMQATINIPHCASDMLIIVETENRLPFTPTKDPGACFIQIGLHFFPLPCVVQPTGWKWAEFSVDDLENQKTFMKSFRKFLILINISLLCSGGQHVWYLLRSMLKMKGEVSIRIQDARNALSCILHFA